MIAGKEITLCSIFMAMIVTFAFAGEIYERKHWTLSDEPLQETAYIVAINGLSLRSEPSQSADLLMVIPFDSKVKLIKRDKFEVVQGGISYWYEITYNDLHGYVHGIFLSLNEPKVKNPGNARYYKLITESLYSGRLSINKEIELGMTLETTIEKLGKPLLFKSGEWRNYIGYNGFWLGFNDFFKEEFDKVIQSPRRKSLFVFTFDFSCTDNRFDIKEILEAFGKPADYHHNHETKRWEVFFKVGMNTVAFYFEDLNSYAYEYEIFKGQ
jgi:hypothetical protein